MCQKYELEKEQKRLIFIIININFINYFLSNLLGVSGCCWYAG